MDILCKYPEYTAGLLLVMSLADLILAHESKKRVHPLAGLPALAMLLMTLALMLLFLAESWCPL